MAQDQESPPRVLIVDDDIILRNVARQSLEQAGFQVSEAVNGVEGLEAVKQLSPDIMLLDVMMPEMDGYDTCSAIRKLPGGDLIPVVMITALEDIDSINRAYEVGATDFITKPIEWTILVQRVRYILRGVRLANERNLLEKRLQQAQKMEAVGTLASGIAHDFMNLIQVIQGSTELVLMGKSDDHPDYQELDAILDAAKRGIDIGRQMLSYSRKLDSIKERIDLNQQIHQVTKLFKKGLAKDANIEVALNLDEDLPLVDADGGQIGQVLMNLAKNAKDAMPDGGKLTIQTTTTTLSPEYCKSYPKLKPGDYVRVSVADSGEGMAQETLDQIFDPFFTTKRADKGTGLGLAMSHGIVKNHDGHITCKSTIGKGTLFRLFLPAVIEPREAVEIKKTDVIESGSETIMLVDDIKQIRHFGKRRLEKAGYSVLTAESGEQALEIYREKQSEIGMILLDLIMPGMGGEACLKELVKINPEVKVIIASANKPEQLDREQIEEQACGFLRKPYLGDDLLRTVRKVLDMK